jgi:hypothetical protein
MHLVGCFIRSIAYTFLTSVLDADGWLTSRFNTGGKNPGTHCIGWVWSRAVLGTGTCRPSALTVACWWNVFCLRRPSWRWAELRNSPLRCMRRMAVEVPNGMTQGRSFLLVGLVYVTAISRIGHTKRGRPTNAASCSGIRAFIILGLGHKVTWIVIPVYPSFNFWINLKRKWHIWLWM